MKLFRIIAVAVVVSFFACSVSIAQSPSTGKGGTSSSTKPGAQTKGSILDRRQQPPSSPNQPTPPPPLQVQLPNLNIALPQSVIDRLKKSKK